MKQEDKLKRGEKQWEAWLPRILCECIQWLNAGALTFISPIRTHSSIWFWQSCGKVSESVRSKILSAQPLMRCGGRRNSYSDPLIKSQGQRGPEPNIKKKAQLFRSPLAFSSAMEVIMSYPGSGTKRAQPSTQGLTDRSSSCRRPPP